MKSKIIKYLAVVLILPMVTGCVRLPPKQKKPETKKVILVDCAAESPTSSFAS